MCRLPIVQLLGTWCGTLHRCTYIYHITSLYKHFIGGLEEVTLHTAFTAIAVFAVFGGFSHMWPRYYHKGIISLYYHTMSLWGCFIG